MHSTSPCTRALYACCTVAIVLALGLGLPSLAQNSAVNFTSSQPLVPGFFAGGAQTNDLGRCNNIILAGKFHNGSRPDLVTTCFFSFPPDDGPFSAVLLNQGNGLFPPVADSAMNFGPAPIQAADLNGDGLSDLVLIWRLGNGGPFFDVQMSSRAGNGTLEAPVQYNVSGIPPGSAVTRAVVGDFEHNGRMDVAVLSSVPGAATSGGPNNLSIFLNDGTGKFTQSATYTLNATPTGFFSPILVAGDINHDGKVDLTVVYTGTVGSIVPYISQGNGKFTKGSSRSAGDKPITAAWGDFNKDGYGDIAVTTPTGFNIILGSSSGNFSSSKFTAYSTPIAALNAGVQIAPGDFDKDGNLDLAVSANNGVDIFWGAGNGTFSTISAYSDGGGGSGLVAADINGDGKLDLVSSSGFNASILYNLGGRSFRAAPSTHSPGANGIVAGDFNRDGRQDLAVVNTAACSAPCNGKVSILVGEGTYFNAGPSYTISMHGSAIAAGDLNGDGIPDLVVTNATSGDNADVSILLGTSSGGFSQARNLTLGSLSNDALLADVNGDGKLDLIEDGGVALGDGRGSFGHLTSFPNGIGYTPNTHLAVADFNGDHRPDVAASWQPVGTDFPQAEVLITKATGDFSGTPLDLVGNGNFAIITGVAAGPLSGAINDIVFAGEVYSGENQASTILVFSNDGKGNFIPGTSDAASGVAHGVVIADFNHDGHNDIGFTGDNYFNVDLGPTFSGHDRPLNATINTSYSVVADFNKDGWPDIVFTSPYGVSRLYNVPVPTVTPAGFIHFSNAGSQKVTVKNTTTTAQSLSAAFESGTKSTPGFTISSNTCGTLAVGASCTVTVSYNGTQGVGAILYISANGQFIRIIDIDAP